MPDSYRLGGVGEGWRVSMTTLMNERAAIGSVVHPRGSGAISSAVAAWKERGHTDAARRDELMRLDRGGSAPADQHAGRREPAPGDPGSRGLNVEAPLGRFQQAHHGFHRLAARRRGAALPERVHLGRPERAGWAPPTLSAISSGRGPTRSRGGPLRSCGTSSASVSSGSPANPEPTRTSLEGHPTELILLGGDRPSEG